MTEKNENKRGLSGGLASILELIVRCGSTFS